MNKLEKVSLFVLLRAFDRFGNMLNTMNIGAPKEATSFISKLWDFLATDNSKLSTRAINRAISSAVVDEQDANDDEVVRNLYFYALSDLLVFFTEGTSDSLGAAESSIIDAYNYIAGQKYLLEKKGGKAVILSDEEEEEIMKDPICSDEIYSLRSDRAFAEGIVDWGRALEFR
ncbi:hypothetical protein [Pseudomonas purpurea]|uniref:hypothetical protein n=1 Tax=Pseudomonas purpurea TaxID=3136737 RepID=UPI00326424DE